MDKELLAKQLAVELIDLVDEGVIGFTPSGPLNLQSVIKFSNLMLRVALLKEASNELVSNGKK